MTYSDDLEDQQQMPTDDTISQLQGTQAGDAGSGGDEGSPYYMDLVDRTQGLGSSPHDWLDYGIRPETQAFLNRVSGIGTGAYLNMLQSDPPQYEDWRDGNFIADGSGSYMSPDGQAYTGDDLERIHGVLSRQAGNPLVSRMFDGPKSQLANYMTWRNQNFANHTGGGWEDEDGNLYTEPALQKMFGAKFSPRPGERSDLVELAYAGAGSGQQDGLQTQDSLSPSADSLKQTAAYMQWRNQNFRRRNDGTWEGPDARVYTDKDLRDVYEIRQKKWPQPRAQAAQSSGTTVTLTYPDGTIETRTGNHPQRDNNPGNMKDGPVSRSQGAIGVDQDKHFAIFPSPEAGWAALDADLKRSEWQNRSLDQAIEVWAPKNDGNDTEKYKKDVRAALGVVGTTKISQLTPEQFEILKKTIARKEGFFDQRPGQKAKVVITLPKRPNVIPRN